MRHDFHVLYVPGIMTPESHTEKFISRIRERINIKIDTVESWWVPFDSDRKNQISGQKNLDNLLKRERGDSYYKEILQSIDTFYELRIKTLRLIQNIIVQNPKVKIIGMGHSGGGLILTHLQKEKKYFDAILALSTPHRMKFHGIDFIEKGDIGEGRLFSTTAGDWENRNQEFIFPETDHYQIPANDIPRVDHNCYMRSEKLAHWLSLIINNIIERNSNPFPNFKDFLLENYSS